jgi:hypothetical protein
MPDTAKWIHPQQVAELMLKMVGDASYEGGTMIEIAGEPRRVELFNDPGPVSLRAASKPHVTAHISPLDEDTLVIIKREKEGEKTAKS